MANAPRGNIAKFRWLVLAAALLSVGCNRGSQETIEKTPLAGTSQPEVTATEVVEEEIIEIVNVNEYEFAQDDWISDFSSSTPAQLRFSCVVMVDPREYFLADKLLEGSSDDQLRAARKLWRGHCRPRAEQVLKFSTAYQSAAPEYLAFRKECADALQPAAILRELRTGNYAWGTWLATFRPHAGLVPDLIKGLGGANLPAATLALGKSRDPRALPPLLEVLQRRDYHDSGFAAAAIGELGLVEAEAPLLAELPGASAWFQANLCRALEKIGTAQSLPQLAEIAASEKYQGAINTREAAKRAMEAIKSREAVDPSALKVESGK